MSVASLDRDLRLGRTQPFGRHTELMSRCPLCGVELPVNSRIATSPRIVAAIDAAHPERRRRPRWCCVPCARRVEEPLRGPPPDSGGLHPSEAENGPENATGEEQR